MPGWRRFDGARRASAGLQLRPTQLLASGGNGYDGGGGGARGTGALRGGNTSVARALQLGGDVARTQVYRVRVYVLRAIDLIPAAAFALSNTSAVAASNSAGSSSASDGLCMRSVYIWLFVCCLCVSRSFLYSRRCLFSLSFIFFTGCR